MGIIERLLYESVGAGRSQRYWPSSEWRIERERESEWILPSGPTRSEMRMMMRRTTNFIRISWNYYPHSTKRRRSHRTIVWVSKRSDRTPFRHWPWRSRTGIPWDKVPTRPWPKQVCLQCRHTTTTTAYSTSASIALPHCFSYGSWPLSCIDNNNNKQMIIPPNKRSPKISISVRAAFVVASWLWITKRRTWKRVLFRGHFSLPLWSNKWSPTSDPCWANMRRTHNYPTTIGNMPSAWWRIVTNWLNSYWIRSITALIRITPTSTIWKKWTSNRNIRWQVQRIKPHDVDGPSSPMAYGMIHYYCLPCYSAPWFMMCSTRGKWIRNWW